MTSEELMALVVAAKDAIFAIESALPMDERRRRFYAIRVSLAYEGHSLVGSLGASPMDVSSACAHASSACDACVEHDTIAANST